MSCLTYFDRNDRQGTSKAAYVGQEGQCQAHLYYLELSGVVFSTYSPGRL